MTTRGDENLQLYRSARKFESGCLDRFVSSNLKERINLIWNPPDSDQRAKISRRKVRSPVRATQFFLVKFPFEIHDLCFYETTSKLLRTTLLGCLLYSRVWRQLCKLTNFRVALSAQRRRWLTVKHFHVQKATALCVRYEKLRERIYQIVKENVFSNKYFVNNKCVNIFKIWT